MLTLRSAAPVLGAAAQRSLLALKQRKLWARGEVMPAGIQILLTGNERPHPSDAGSDGALTAL